MTDDPIEKCTTCGCELLAVYHCCDETMGQYCDDCWPEVDCHAAHGECCSTAVFQ